MAKIIMLLAAFLMLAGCSPTPMEELFRVPELPLEFVEFNDQLSTIRSNGAEFTSPISGMNRQSVQLMDLDNDGVDEGIAFATKQGAEKKAFMYLLKKKADGYEILAELEGAGNIVESVAYADLAGTGNFSVIISWGLEDSGARTLTAYELLPDSMVKLIEVPFLYYTHTDMDSDGVTDLCIVMPDSKEKSLELCLFTQTMGEFRMQSYAPLSQNAGEIKKIRAGNVSENVPGVFVDSVDAQGRLITDLIIFTGGRLKNITRSEDTGASDSTRRELAVYCEDADLDGYIEVPMPVLLPGYEKAKPDDRLYGISWRDPTDEKLFAYHDYADAWQLAMPAKWRGRVTVDRFSRERGAMFYGVSESGKKTHLFSIHVLTGESRYTRAMYTGRFQLAEKQNVIYAASIKENKYLGIEITESSLREMFRVRDAEWSSGEVVVQ